MFSESFSGSRWILWSARMRDFSILYKAHNSKSYLIPALSHLNQNLIPYVSWLFCPWLWIKTSSWTWGIFPTKLLSKPIRRWIAREMWTSIACYTDYLTWEAFCLAAARGVLHRGWEERTCWADWKRWWLAIIGKRQCLRGEGRQFREQHLDCTIKLWR